MSAHVNKNKLYATLTGKKQHYIVKLLEGDDSPRTVGKLTTCVVVGVRWLAANKPEVVAKLMTDKINGKGAKAGKWIGGSVEDEAWEFTSPA